ncbi:MAG: sulfurtransferase-like selenium metabolism protein YedF [Clostridiales bacterium]
MDNKIIKTINALGWQCPKPIIEVKKVLDRMEKGIVEITIDNDLALANLLDFSLDRNYRFYYQELENSCYKVIIEKDNQSLPIKKDDDDLLILITGDVFGYGNDDLGAYLMKSYIYALTEVAPQPQTMIFMNKGVFLTCQDSPVLESLQALSAMGVEIYSCGACLNFYDLEDSLVIGKVGNMYQFTEMMNKSTNCIKL